MPPKKITHDDNFAHSVLAWFDAHGRHDLPWQQAPTPSRVWVSEIMLQQTQVGTVIPYFQRFMARFPDIAALATADTDQVLHLWTGLGYYARARNLHRTAQIVYSELGGEFPRSVDGLMTLAGIGQSTAGAIAALGMGIRAPILDGNVKRVLTRFFAIAGWPEQTTTKNRLWELAESLTPTARVADYTQAMMDLGATLCTRSKPACANCPLQLDCAAYRSGDIASFPGKKPKRALPVKRVAMFVLLDENGSVLLEKRPPSGIWGSLYSLPESAETDTPEEVCGISVAGLAHTILPVIKHTFSHYHLLITPRVLKLSRPKGGVADSNDRVWYPLDHTLEIGLAAPVRKLLTGLANSLG